MKKTGAYLTVYALEQIGIRHTYGIPGVHNTEIYDALNSSSHITPVLVTHESGASFMADATSRTSGGIGVCVIVPAAGLTHAMSGIGEAFLDGIPALIISGGTRRDSQRKFQLHQLDQGRVLDGIIKKYYLIQKHDQIIPVIFEACNLAMSGLPGPVFVEIPVEIQMFQGDVGELPAFRKENPEKITEPEKIRQAADLLAGATCPGIYAGWGAVHASHLLVQLAELLGAPVSTTLQGLSCFPADHPLHTGVGFGPSAVPAAQKAFRDCDTLLAAGVRFAELATGSYGMKIPGNLIHADIDREVFNKNYPAAVTLEGDSADILKALLDTLRSMDFKPAERTDRVKILIAKEKSQYKEDWMGKPNPGKVSPGHFFHNLRNKLPPDAYVISDDGKHTFLTAELFPVLKPRRFVSPTDFNCMGYCVPAAIACKLNNPGSRVIGIVGDGAFLMTGLELLTAKTYRAGVIIFVFHDGELGQISQFQKIPLNRKTCTQLGILNIEGIALATGTQFLQMKNDDSIEGILDRALAYSDENIPVLVDVNIDYSRKTNMTKGVVRTNLSRFPSVEKARFIFRALKRHLGG